MSWNLVTLQDKRALVFRYVDPQAGPSAKGAFLAGAEPTIEEAQAAVSQPAVTVRLAPVFPLTPLSPEEVRRLALPDEPQWLSFYARDTPWTADARLRGAFHPEFPDDLQAAFHFPSTGQVEQMWVRLTSAEPGLDAYRGTLLNTAHSDPRVAAGESVLVRPAPGSPMPIWLSAVVQENLRGWSAKCESCGFDLVVEPVKTLIARHFPTAPADAVFEALTTRCALCRGTQVLSRRGTTAHEPSPGQPAPAATPPATSPKLIVGLVVAALALAGLAWRFWS